MPNEQFIEQYPLYRKFHVDSLPPYLNALPKVRINMTCGTCKSLQTFSMTNNYWELFSYTNVPVDGVIFRMAYQCQHCVTFEREFFVKIDPNKKWLMKIGQFPAWDTAGNEHIERLLGVHSGYYKKGLVCESQGY